MSLDDQLAELLNSLGVRLEETSDAPHARDENGNTNEDASGRASRGMARSRQRRGAPGQAEQAGKTGQAEHPGAGERAANPLEETVSAYQHPDEWDDDDELMAPAELSLFQTSREHYGVFYRLDLVSGTPHLRVFAPDEEGALKMRCYLVRPALGAPVRDWFGSTRAHHGSDAFGASRETIEQHLLFAAGEALKRLFWSGEPERMRFPWEIEVERVA